MGDGKSNQANQGTGKRVLYILRSVAHFSYHESTLKELVAKGHEVQLLFDPKWSANRSLDYVNRWISDHGLKPFQWCVLREDRWRPALSLARELRSCRSYMNRDNQSPFYLQRWEGYLPKNVREALNAPKSGPLYRKALQSPLGEAVLRSVESLAPACPRIEAFIASFSPDVVVISPVNMRFSEEIEYLKAAKKLGIPTSVPVLSWDNLTTKGLIHVEPDLVLAWNASHEKEAISIHGIPPERVVRTGSPFFDKWFGRKRGTTEEKRAFLAKVGLDPDKPYVTYLGSSGNIAKDESWIIQQMAESLLKGPEGLRDMQILVRPHPANYQNLLKLDMPNVRMWPKPPFDFEMGVPESAESRKDFALSLDCCVATVGINTSAMIESVITDRSTMAFFSAKYSKTQEEAAHFRHLIEYDVLEKVASVEEFMASLGAILRNQDKKRRQRQRFVNEFIRPFGTRYSAGYAQASAIDLLSRQRPKSAREMASLQKEYYAQFAPVASEPVETAREAQL